MNAKSWLAAILVVCISMLFVNTAEASSRTTRVHHVHLTIDVSGLTAFQQQELRCHSLNIYHEARGSTLRNQVAVAWVVRNRMASLGRSACEVIFAPRQFSWTNRKWGRPREAEAWQRSQHLALRVMQDQIMDITGGATHFHEHQIRPSWSRSAKHTVRIGAHVFHRIELAQAP